jgi:tripartite-type tricarboxylate transporter receptor subunit TctC
MRKRHVLALAALALSWSSFAHAQAWPTRPITLVVPFPAGGANDIPARQLANELSLKFGQQVVVDNRSGANGNIGAAVVAKAEPDGYTLLFSAPGVLTTNRFMYKNMPFDPDRAFAPVILMAKSPLIIVANPRLPARNLKELIEHAKANPGKLNAGIPSAGSQAHLTLELLAKQSGITMTYVPYRGGVNVNADLLGGQIDVGINFTPGLVELVNNRSLRGIAVTTTERLKQFPNVPTVHELGFPWRLPARRGRSSKNSTRPLTATSRPISAAISLTYSTCSPPAERPKCCATISPAKSPNGARSSRRPGLRCRFGCHDSSTTPLPMHG